MSDPRTNLPPEHLLSAYADGELDLVRQAEALRRMSADSAAARAVEGQVRLREAVGRVLSTEPGPDADLISKIEALAFQMPPAEPKNQPRIASAAPTARPGFFFRPMAIAAAVGLLGIGVLLGHFALRPADSGKGIASNAPSAVEPAAAIPVSYVNAATRTHVQCSRFAEGHDHDGWPAEIAGLQDPVKAYLKSDQAHPDLTSAGYTYVGCGPCGRPLQRGIHLLYQGRKPGDTVSLFIEPFKGQVSIPVGECRTGTTTDAAHPAVVWRTNDLVFVLVANAQDPIDQVRKQMKLPTPI